MAIDLEEVRRIARLARLELSDRECERLAGELGAVLEHVAILDGLDLSDEAGAEAEAGGDPRWRADEVRDGLAPEQALDNAADHAEGMFRVPRSFPE